MPYLAYNSLFNLMTGFSIFKLRFEIALLYVTQSVEKSPLNWKIGFD